MKQHHRVRSGGGKRPSSRLGTGWLLVALLAVAPLTVLAVRASWSREQAPASVTPTSPASSGRSLRPAAFASTIPNTTGSPGSTPAGMVWIPGGEFSMGSHVESDGHCARPGITRDALPVHRV